MPATLLEREATLEALSRAVTDAAAGRGSVALVTGEAGIGKTSWSAASSARPREHARILLSACDDLMAPRTLGPLRDAALGRDGPLAAALARRRAGRGRLHRAARGAGGRAADRARGRGPPLGGRRDARRPRATPRAGSSRPGRCSCSPFRDERSIRATRSSACSACSRAVRCTGSSCTALSRDAVRTAVRRHRRRPRGGPPHHARQPVLRHRGARIAARRRARERRWRPCWRASAGSATTAARRSTSSPSCRRTSSLDLAAELLGPRIDALAEAEVGRRDRGPRRTASRSGTSSPAGRSSAACRRCGGAASTPPWWRRCAPSRAPSPRA